MNRSAWVLTSSLRPQSTAAPYTSVSHPPLARVGAEQTSLGYTLSGRHWLRMIDSSASAVTHSVSCFSVIIQPGMMQFTRMWLSRPF